METISLSIICVSLVALGTLTLITNIKGKANIYFFLITLFASLWILVNFFSNTETSLPLAILYNKLIFSITSLLAYFLFLFSTVYPNSRSEPSVRSKILSFFLTLISVVVSQTQFLVKEIEIVDNRSEIIFGPGIIIYLIQFVIFTGFFLYNIVKSYKTSEGVERVKIQYLFLGVFLSLVFTSITNLLMPILLSDFSLSNIGPVFLLFFIGFTTVSIIRFRLFGIRFLFAQILNFTLLASIPFLSFYGIYFLLEKFFGDIHQNGAYAVGIVLSLLFSYLFIKAKDKLQSVFLGKFAYRGFDPNQLINEYTKDISTELNLNNLANYVINLIKYIFNVKDIGIVIFKEDKNGIIFEKVYGYENSPEFLNELLKVTSYWDNQGNNYVLIKDEIEEDKLTDKNLEIVSNLMDKFNIEVILPLNKRVDLNGLVFFGKREDKKNLTAEEIKFLENIVINTSVATGRAILYQEVKQFNETLQSKVSEQTEELQIKVKQLEEARKKERDMIDIMGHELRTPATVVKLNAELLGNFTEDIMNNRDKFELYIKRIKTAVDNEIKLINTLLSSAKLEGNRIELKKEEINIVEDIEMAIHGHEVDIQGKNLKIINNVDKNVPSIYADHSRIIEVLNNLLSNAVKYTDAGSVTVGSSFNEDTVSVSVEDTGKGIPQEEISKLGRKFYRLENYLGKEKGRPDLVRPGGTGLGLYVTFGLIEKMDGKIDVVSEIGKGTKFTFTLPRFKAQNDGTKEIISNNMFERLGLKR